MEIKQLQDELDQINSFITKLENESEIAKADPQYPNTLGVYTRLKETYESRIAAIVSPEAVVISSPEIVDQVADEVLPDIAFTEVKKKKK